eukprot:3152378-Pleurochrysis_carterae.AAC.3
MTTAIKTCYQSHVDEILCTGKDVSPEGKRKVLWELLYYRDIWEASDLAYFSYEKIKYLCISRNLSPKAACQIRCDRFAQSPSLGITQPASRLHHHHRRAHASAVDRQREASGGSSNTSWRWTNHISYNLRFGWLNACKPLINIHFSLRTPRTSSHFVYHGPTQLQCQ